MNLKTDGSKWIHPHSQRVKHEENLQNIIKHKINSINFRGKNNCQFRFLVKIFCLYHFFSNVVDTNFKS